jgi:sulfhydrogenase subunit alpha
MSREVNIHVEHLTRVEGHGNIILNAKDGKLDVTWEVSEAPRFFESFVKGKHYSNLARITSRICGICSISHSLVSVKATEAAMGIEISEQATILRKLGLHAEHLQSHILHVGYLVAPDLFGVGSVIPLVGSHPDAVLAIVKLHRIANEMSDLLCGRTTHPTNIIPGGLWQTPSPQKLKELRQILVDSVPTVAAVGEVVLANAGALPNFTRETEYISLVADDEYALYDGAIGSTDTGRHSVDDYLSITNEYVVPQSTAKYCKHNRESYFTGALARINLSADKLHPLAKEWAGKFGLKPMNYNPYMNSVAQLIEFIHSIEDSIALIDSLFDKGLKNEKRPKLTPRAGQGVGVVEAPRGILFHDYTYNDKGICTKANCIIPTNQNHSNIQKDMEALAPTILDKSDKEIELTLEMLVRAYDPCISCSTHYLTVDLRR